MTGQYGHYEVIREARRCIDAMQRLGLDTSRVQPLLTLVVDQEERLLELEMHAGLQQMRQMRPTVA